MLDTRTNPKEKEVASTEKQASSRTKCNPQNNKVHSQWKKWKETKCFIKSSLHRRINLSIEQVSPVSPIEPTEQHNNSQQSSTINSNIYIYNNLNYLQTNKYHPRNNSPLLLDKNIHPLNILLHIENKSLIHRTANFIHTNAVPCTKNF